MPYDQSQYPGTTQPTWTLACQNGSHTTCSDSLWRLVSDGLQTYPVIVAAKCACPHHLGA